MAELKKIEIRKKERERRQQDLQKLITAAESTTESRLVLACQMADSTPGGTVVHVLVSKSL